MSEHPWSLETPRLLIRRIEPGDVDTLVALWSDPEVTRYVGGPREPEQLRASLVADLAAAAPPSRDLWTVVEKASGRVVGNCGLLEKTVEGQPEVEVAYVLARWAWGHGYATEAAAAVCKYAFKVLGLRRLVSLIDPPNAASLRVAARLGMRLKGETTRPDGRRLLLLVVEQPGEVG
ncbi:MAG TPA: GNAT family N-acetyltransferase [Anaerolineae bacterium]|nr:GNAT family N-acetyltransferase [Anaerolineae bacterium]